MKPIVLMVGVEKVLHRYLSLLFKTNNIDLKIAGNEEEASQWLKKNSPDLVITEFMPMPTASYIQKNSESLEKVSKVPFIVITSCEQEIERYLTEPLMKADIIQMPFSPLGFMDKVKKAISNRTH